ncbi:hypothetical protein [Nocardia rhamnosiphila]
MTARPEELTAAQSPPPGEVAERPQNDADTPSRSDGAAAQGSQGDDAAAQKRRNKGAAQDLLDDGVTREPLEDGATQGRPDDGVTRDRPDDGAAQDRRDDGAAQDRLDDGAAQRAPDDGAAPERQEDGAVQTRPGGTRYRQRELRRTALATLLAAVLTPVAVGIAANGAATAGRWWDTTDRWLSPAQSVLGAGLLLVVAGLAAYEPAAAVIAGLVWGAVPAAVQIAAPGQTYRLISSLPGLPTDLARALHTWLSSGMLLLIGVLLAGAGIAVALRRRGLPG